MKSLILLSAMLVFTSAFANSDYKISTTDTIKKKKVKVKKSNMNMEVVYSTTVNAFCKFITTGDYETVVSMIKAGEDINQKSVGLTPLMYAARYNRVPIVKLLIANGAELDAKSDKGYTALKYAKICHADDAYKVIEKAIIDKKSTKKTKRRKNRS